MLLSHFNGELDKTAIIFEFLRNSFSDLEKLFLDRTLTPLSKSLNRFIFYVVIQKKVKVSLYQ